MMISLVNLQETLIKDIRNNSEPNSLINDHFNKTVHLTSVDNFRVLGSGNISLPELSMRSYI